jgi:uncharacterized protein
MHVSGTAIQLSASDLVGHINCRYLTGLDLKVAKGTLAKPVYQDPGLDLLIERGRLHEKGYLEHLKARGLAATFIEGVGIDATSLAPTLLAMKAGVPVCLLKTPNISKYSVSCATAIPSGA